MDQMLKEKLNAVRQLLMRWTGVQDVQIQHLDDFDDAYIVAIDCGDILKFLRENPQARQAKLGARNLASGKH
ncbi:hypothetical protein MRX96_021188 [Rhipicephalus microplus]